MLTIAAGIILAVIILGCLTDLLAALVIGVILFVPLVNLVMAIGANPLTALGVLLVTGGAVLALCYHHSKGMSEPLAYPCAALLAAVGAWCLLGPIFFPPEGSAPAPTAAEVASLVGWFFRHPCFFIPAYQHHWVRDEATKKLKMID